MSSHPHAASVSSIPYFTTFKTVTFVAILAVVIAAVSCLSAGDLYWNTNGSSATLTTANWGTTAGGPFTTAWTNSSNVLFTSNSSITYVTATPVGDLSISGGSTVTWTGAGTFSTGGAIRTFDIGTGSVLNWSGQNVSTAAGTGFIKNGGGTWNITNTMGSGAAPAGFTLNAGTIITGSANGLGGGPLTLNGGTWQSSSTLSYNVSSISVGGDFTLSGTGNAILAGASAPLSLGAATRTITNSTTSGSRQFLGVISGASGAGLTMAGSGAAQIYLGNTGNTFTGPLSVNGGEVVINGGGALGAGTIVSIDGGRLTMASMDSSGTAGALTAATITSTHGIQIGDTAGTAISVQGSTGVTTYDGVISDVAGKTGSWAKQGSGVLKLGGASTYTGNTAINNGTVQLTTGSNRLPTTTAVSLGQAASTNLGALDLNGLAQEIAGLDSVTGTNAGATKNTVTSSASATLTINSSADHAYGDGSTANSGVIAGSVSVVKKGSGTQTFGDNNTYSGGTTIMSGMIVALGTGKTALGSGAVTVQNTGGLSGTATVSGDTTVQSGGTVTGGTGAAGTLSFSHDLIFESGAHADFHLYGVGSNSTLNVGNALTLQTGTTQAFRVLLDYSPSSAASFNLLDWASFTAPGNDLAAQLALPTLSGGLTWDTSTFNSNGVLSIVAAPEPSRALLMLVATGSLALRRRR